MTDTTTYLPEYVLRRAAELMGWGKDRSPGPLRSVYGAAPTYRALCDALMAPPLEPPVDRKLLVARDVEACELAERAPDYRAGYYDTGWQVQIALNTIELWEEGFGL